MEFTLANCRLRPPRRSDAPELVALLNEYSIWQNMRDRLPHPYRLDDAHAFLDAVVDQTPQGIWFVDIDGRVAGAIGLHAQPDVLRRTLEIGYWVGVPYQGRGIASAIVPVIVDHAFASRPDVIRVQADVFAWNAASMRVLAKAGFVHEAVLRDAVTKDGRVTDMWVWSVLRRDHERRGVSP